jgi:hypothetical protein
MVPHGSAGTIRPFDPSWLLEDGQDAEPHIAHPLPVVPAEHRPTRGPSNNSPTPNPPGTASNRYIETSSLPPNSPAPGN